MSRKPAVRLGDLAGGHEGYPPTPAMGGSPDVSINGRPAVRQGDPAVPHARPNSAPHARAAAEGSGSVLINGKPVARLGDKLDCDSTWIKGSNNVIIGDRPKHRNPIESAEWDELVAKLAAPQTRPDGGLYERSRLAAQVAVKYRGREGAIATWHEHYYRQANRHDPLPARATDPAEHAGLQRARREIEAEVAMLRAYNPELAESLGRMTLPAELGPAEAAKARRWRCRRHQIAQGKARAEAMPPGGERDRLSRATERFQRNNVAVEKARLSGDAYHPEQGPPPGWRNVSRDTEKLKHSGLKKEHLQKPGSDFRAQMYEPDPAVFGDDLRPTIAFKGTTSAEDWSNNIRQGLDMDSTYYEAAVRIGLDTGRAGADIEFAGHSLGGGLASAAGRASGRPTHTFNAAGLHPNTVSRYGGSPVASQREYIQAYRVEGELLAGAQEPGWRARSVAAAAGYGLGGPAGAATGLALGELLDRALPDAVGEKHTVPGKGDPLARHSIDQVIDGIEAQKAHDQALIAERTGISCH